MAMARIWAGRMIAGTRTWAEVPAVRKPLVKQVLEGIAADEDNPDHEKAQELLDEINAE